MKPFVWALVLGLGVTTGLQANETVAAGQPLALVIKEKVQKELKLTEAQVSAVKKAYEDAGKDESAGKAALATLAKELDAEQLKRLKQISYQVRGGSMLADPEVVKALGLSRTQARSLAEIWRNEEESLRQILRVTRFRNAAAKRKFILEQRKGAGKKMLESLPEEVQAQVKKLQGKAIDLAGLDN